MINSASALLEGVKVLELGQSVAGPWAGTILADLGATVIKIEAPKGDSARGWGPPFIRGDAAVYQFMNRNKLGMVLDLKDIGIKQLNISNVAARQELRDLIKTVKLPSVEANF